MHIKFSQLDVGDMFNTLVCRYVKKNEHHAIVVVDGIYDIGDIHDIDDSILIIPLYVSTEQKNET